MREMPQSTGNVDNHSRRLITSTACEPAFGKVPIIPVATIAPEEPDSMTAIAGMTRRKPPRTEAHLAALRVLVSLARNHQIGTKFSRPGARAIKVMPTGQVASKPIMKRGWTVQTPGLPTIAPTMIHVRGNVMIGESPTKRRGRYHLTR